MQVHYWPLIQVQGLKDPTVQSFIQPSANTKMQLINKQFRSHL